MTVPINKDEIDNLKKIAELNKEAGDWVYSPVRKPLEPDSAKAMTQHILARVGKSRLSKGRQ